LLKDPKNQQPTDPITIRREKKAVLELVLDAYSHPISSWGWECIQLPQTGSVQSAQQIFSEELLRLSTLVFGCSTGVLNTQPCDRCWDRERKKPNVCPASLQRYMIDFNAENVIIALSKPLDGNAKCLKADVTFHFTCYSKHGREYGYASLAALYLDPF
jgi:hypothetical protein